MKKLFLIILTLLICFSFSFGVGAFAEEEQFGLLEEQSWSGSAKEEENKIKFTGNAYSTAPIELVDDYISIEFSLDSMGEGHSATWASYSIISKPIQVSPAGGVNANGLYFLFYDFDGQLTVSLLHKGPLGETYQGIEDPVYGAKPAIGEHILEVFVIDEVVNIFIDGIQYKRALLSGIYKDDFCSLDGYSYISYASFGGEVSSTLLGYSTENDRDLEAPVIEVQVESEGFVGEEFILNNPNITDNADNSFAVNMEIFDPTGLKISVKDGKFISAMEGEYKINYRVLDASGNEKFVSHTVTVTQNSKGCGSMVAGSSLISLLLVIGCSVLLVNKVKSKQR